MRALIIGCGYIGLAVGRELAQAGHEVHGIRRTSTTDPQLRSQRIYPLSADVTRPETFSTLRPDYDWVINCVSSTGGGAERYRQVYLEGTRNLLKWLRSSPPQSFVYTSSSSVYGQSDGSIVDETSPIRPAAQTAKILAQTEQELLEAQRKGRLNAVVLRLAGIYGPDRGYWLRAFLKGEARREHDEKRWLNLIHRDDVVGAISAALQQGTPGEIYNVVDDEPVTQLRLYQWLSAKTGRPLPPVSHDPVPGERKRGFTNKRVSNRKLRKKLGYVLKYPSFREGFTRELEQGF